MRPAGYAEALLDASAAAALLLTAGDVIAHMNRAAAQLVAAADGLCSEAGRLMAADAAHAASFQQFLAAARRAAPGSIRGIVLPRAGQPWPLHVAATPLAAAGTGDAEPAVGIFTSDPAGVAPVPGMLLHALYRFTPAETAIANALLTGYSIGEIAALRQVTSGTIRQQLKHILHKSGSARQSDLVRRLMSLPRFRTP